MNIHRQKHKTMNIILLSLIYIGFSIGFISCGSSKPSDQNDYEHKADSIIKLMTLEEKIGQLTLFTSGWDVTGPVMNKDTRDLIKQGKVGGIFNAYTVDYVKDLQKIAVEETRLKIPLIFGYDVIHGHRTIFPIPLGQASSWDTSAIQQSERFAATEASAEGINWTFAPMVDIARDPRWGRVSEGAGEDTWLGSKIAASRVRGFQGTNLKAESTILACVKHFAAYGAPQAGRDYNTVDMSELSLFEWYLPPYKAAVDAGAGSVMTSFNEIAGVPSTSNSWLLNNLLRDKWNFNGFVVTDYTSINELIPHGVATDLSHAASLAINAGVDMDMEGSAYYKHLQNLVKSGKVKETTINNAVKRILIAKYKLGLFDNPYRYCNKEREKSEIMRPEFLSFAREFAAKSCVLLKNEKQTLPLKKSYKNIALIGPLGNSKKDMLGNWSAAGQADKCITLFEGLTNNLPADTKVTYVKGCDINSSDISGFDKAINVAKSSDFIILALGESGEMSGEAASRTSISLPGLQTELAKTIFKIGKPGVIVLFNGRPLAISDIDSIAPSILETWFGGTQAGNAIADVLLGKYNPSGKLTMTFPQNIGQIPIFYNAKNTGRPFDPGKPDDKYKSRYIDAPNTPLYPFGYGLSYTTFSYSPITINKTLFQKQEIIIASADITNTGNYDGEEVVQLYIQDLVGEVTRPVKELKGFRKIFLKKGQTTKVTFTLSPDNLSYYHSDMHFGWDPGKCELYIGTNSTNNQSIPFSIQ
jgi:beta-glucosidase